MIADGVPGVAQAVRLGHVLKDKIQRVHSEVADEVETLLLDGLQQCWEKAVVNAGIRYVVMPSSMRWAMAWAMRWWVASPGWRRPCRTPAMIMPLTARAL